MNGSYAKKDGQTKLKQSTGSKTVAEERHLFADPFASGKAPTSRLYTQDYTKVGNAPDDKDITSIYVGNPLKL